jgi:hypothetical protein
MMKVHTLRMVESVFSRYTQHYYFAFRVPRQLSLEINREAVIISPRIYPAKEICPDFVLSVMGHGRLLSEYGRAVFPLVHTVSFRYFIPGTAKAVYGFLSLRKKVGLSHIHTLDFTKSNAPESCFLRFVQHLRDVEVLPKRTDIGEDGPVLEDCEMEL